MRGRWELPAPVDGRYTYLQVAQLLSASSFERFKRAYRITFIVTGKAVAEAAYSEADVLTFLAALPEDA